MLLLIDNYDSFTYNLKDYLGQLGEECLVVRNDEISIEALKQLHFTKIVISPGPQRPADAGILMDVLKEFHSTHPILGICLGHQAIGEFFGGELVKAIYPMHGKVSDITHAQEGIFVNIPTPFRVCRYHSLTIESVSNTPLKVMAQTISGEVMALKHSELPIWGVQFHPEAILTQYGMVLLKNWLSLCNREKTYGF